MAMSVIASYVICMRASSGIRYVVQNFRLGIHIKRTVKLNRLKLRSNTGTRPWRVNANVGRPFFVHRYMVSDSTRRRLRIHFRRFNIIYHLNRNIYEGQIYVDQ